MRASARYCYLIAMNVLHLINKQKTDGPGLRHLKRSKTEPDVWCSGYWDMPLDQAETLIGGMLFLHETKAKPSRFGGRVLSVKPEDRPEFQNRNRVIFKVQALPEGRGVKWRGARHAMAHSGGIIKIED